MEGRELAPVVVDGVHFHRIEELRTLVICRERAPAPRKANEFSSDEAAAATLMLDEGKHPIAIARELRMHPYAMRELLDVYEKLGGQRGSAAPPGAPLAGPTGVFLTAEQIGAVAAAMGSSGSELAKAQTGEAAADAVCRRLRRMEATNANLLEELNRARAQSAARDPSVVPKHVLQIRERARSGTK